MLRFLKTIKRHLLRLTLSLGILIFFVLHVTKTLEWPFIHELELKFYDFRLEVTMPKVPDLRVVIVDIDEKSLKEIGHWPWNRLIMADLVDKLFNTYEINTLGFDIIFPEPDDSSGLKVLQKLAQESLQNIPEYLDKLRDLEESLDYDAIFAKSLQNRQIALAYAFVTYEEQKIETGQLPPPIFTAQAVKEYGLEYVEGRGFVTSLPQFQQQVQLVGHFVSSPDSDGIVRRVPMLYGYQGALYESLALAVTRLALGLPDIELNIVTDNNGYHEIESLHLGNYMIPVDRYFQSFIPFRGKHGSFPYISASDVLRERIPDPNLLKNAIVLVGTSAQGLMDLRATPVESTYPGVEVHANLITGILDQVINKKPAYINGAEFLLVFTVGLIMIFIVSLFSPVWATVVTLSLFGGVFWLNLFFWQQLHIILPIAATLLTILSLFIFNMSFGYFTETSHKRELAALFGQYVPPELVSEMSKNLGQNFSMEGESRELTVFFSDVRSFTTISEGLDPKTLSELMNAYLTPMTSIIHDYRGTIDKYMGDAIMAFWGAPLADPTHARHALDAGMAMLARLEEMQSQFAARGWPPIKIGMGLNTGIMSVGNMGSKFRMAYTVMGDAVNLGSRLEGLTKQYGVQIIVSETTKAAAPDYVYRELDRVRVKGKDHSVAIFEPIGPSDSVTPTLLKELTRWEQTLADYRQQHWDKAHEQCVLLHQEYPERLLYRIYAERIEHFSHDSPGENWDGVYTFKTK